MFSYPPVDIDELTSVTHEWKKVLVAPNGKHPAEPVQMKFPPDTNFQTFLEKSGPRVNVTPATRAFNESGEEVFDFEQLLDDEVVYLSKKEAFCRGRQDEASDVIGGYVVKEAIGEGGFGRVMKAVHPETGEIVAIKLINKRSFTEITDADRVFVEIQALRDLSHKHVIKMKDVVDNPKFICFIMEFATNGELRDYVSKKGHLEENEARTFFEQVIKGVHYCHSKNIVHRDLKLENILLDEDNRCKIADFGLSHFVVDNAATVTEGGTQAYLAPEVWNGTSKESNPFQLDVWALGVILFAMTHGRLPFQRPDRHTIEKTRKEGLPFDSSISPALKRTITAMLHPEPRKRIRISDLMNDPWLRQVLPWEVHQVSSSSQLGASDNPKFDRSATSSRRSSVGGADSAPSPPATIEQAVELDVLRRRSRRASNAARSTSQKPAAVASAGTGGNNKNALAPPAASSGVRSGGQHGLQYRLTVAQADAAGGKGQPRSKASPGGATSKRLAAPGGAVVGPGISVTNETGGRQVSTWAGIHVDTGVSDRTAAEAVGGRVAEEAVGREKATAATGRGGTTAESGGVSGKAWATGSNKASPQNKVRSTTVADNSNPFSTAAQRGPRNNTLGVVSTSKGGPTAAEKAAGGEPARQIHK